MQVGMKNYQACRSVLLQYITLYKLKYTPNTLLCQLPTFLWILKYYRVNVEDFCHVSGWWYFPDKATCWVYILVCTTWCTVLQ